MTDPTNIERDALRLVSVGAVHIRSLARRLPDSPEARAILALADAMHNIPKTLAGPADERQASAAGIRYDVSMLEEALGTKRTRAEYTTPRAKLILVNSTKQAVVDSVD